MEEKSRLAHLLGEMQRQMNGAVVGGMRFYGEEYGLNYGVSIPTIRNLGRAEKMDHRLARLLYKQEVRELRLLAGWVADSTQASDLSEKAFWLQGIINSEVAEELAFALLHRLDWVEELLESKSELQLYCATLALAKRIETKGKEYASNILSQKGGVIQQNIASHPNLLPKGVVAMLASALKLGVNKNEISTFLESLQPSKASDYIKDEISWRLEFA